MMGRSKEDQSAAPQRKVLASKDRFSVTTRLKSRQATTVGDRNMSGEVPDKSAILVVHRSPVVRLGLSRLIQQTERFEVCGECDDAPMSRGLFAAHRPRLIVLGLSLNRGDGVQLIKDFRKMDSAASSLVFSAREDPLSLRRAFRAGARGYLTSLASTEHFLEALATVAAGAVYVSPTLTEAMIGGLMMSAMPTIAKKLSALSDREMEVFILIGKRQGITQIAKTLSLSGKTIETLASRIKEKLSLANSAALKERATSWLAERIRQRLQRH